MILPIICSFMSVVNIILPLFSNDFVPHRGLSKLCANLGAKTNEVVMRSEFQEDNDCLTPGCIHAASMILKYMDTTIDPCEDFYQFTCGNFVKNTNIPDDKSSVTSFSLIHDQLQEQIRKIIEVPIGENELKPFRFTKILYKACMNETLIKENSRDTLQNILDFLGGWPVLQGRNWNQSEFDWKKSVYRFKEIGYSVNYFIAFSVGTDLKNSTKRVIGIDQPSLELSREFLVKGFSEELVNAYYEYMVDIAVMLGAKRDEAEKELKLALEFEIELAKISIPKEQRRNVTNLYNPMTVQGMQKMFSTIPWREYINRLLAPHVEVEDEEVVLIYAPSYIKEFESLISRTPKRVQANYVMWRVVASSVSYLSEEFRSRKFLYTKKVTGSTERTSRWKECVEVSSNSMPIASGALYVRKFFNSDAKENALEMVNDIRKEFEIILENNIDWMDDQTKNNAIKKAKAIETHIAYPDELLDDKKIEDYYDELELDENNYLISILIIRSFETRYSFKRLREPVNKTDWITHAQPTTVNAYYSLHENSIQFPAGILQGNFFSAERPRYMNYGAIGAVIGHEITHGFDDVGRQFDKDGNLNEWWKPTTKEAFIEKAKCIIEQYSNYTVPDVGIMINGINTQGENIADNGGLKEAYLAYKRWVSRHGDENPLPGLPFTPHQAFWISFAHMYCEKRRPETVKVQVVTDTHSPHYFRVIGSLSNSKFFAKDFNCPLGSPMNPRKKCSVW